jgi:hypothetical protein
MGTGGSARTPSLTVKTFSGSVMCSASGCEQEAAYLFRSSGKVWAQCEEHARATARRYEMELPARAPSRAVSRFGAAF